MTGSQSAISVTSVEPPKATSYAYGSRSQQKMLEKYRNRANNHWKVRIACAHELVVNFVAPLHAGRPKSEVVAVDVGCSIGMFALEMAREGYKSYGVDFDPAAIAIAKELAKEEGLAAEFLTMDVSDWRSVELPPIDVAICFDIFEHLHDDEIGALLNALRRTLSPKGRVVFSTTPTQYSYLWVGGSLKLNIFRALTLGFAWLPPGAYRRWVKILAALMDALLIAVHGADHRELIKREKHCNPLTRERLEDVFHRAGYEFDNFQTLNLHAEANPAYRKLSRHSITHSHLIGVARPKSAQGPA